VGDHRGTLLRVLGPLEVGSLDQPAPLGGRHERLVLALLVIHANEVVSLDRLIDALWGASPPPTAAHTLQSLISRLRRVVGAGRITARRPGYVLSVGASDVDATRFTELVRAGLGLTDQPERAAAAFEEALAMWRGPPYAEFADEPFAVAEVARLEELRMCALEGRAAALVELDRGNEAIGELESLIAEQPLRERPRSILMLALSRTGRPVEALRCYEGFRRFLAEEVGVVPSQALRRLNDDIVAQAPDASWQRAGARRAPRNDLPSGAARPPMSGRPFSSPRSPDAALGNLPLQPSSFVGRERELAAVASALGAARLVTLVGAGGVGKTRLALEVAAEVSAGYPDGTWSCELGAAGGGHDVAQVVGVTLGVRPGQEAGFEDSIVSFLQYKRLLLVLDNCEHVLDAAARLCERVLARCANVRVLATSREALAVEGEHVWPLQPLPVPEEGAGLEAVAACAAPRLFAERACEARPEFSVDAANADAVGEICRRLDGIPLAIELAAARITAMQPGEIAELLDARFRLLTSGRRGAASRHQTLRAAVEWSCSLLDDRDRTVFERSGAFTGSFTAASAIAVVAGEELDAWDVIDALLSLVRKSMVTAQDAPDGTTRYVLLETLRDFARQRLAERGEMDVWRRRHAAHYAEVAEEIGQALLGPDELVWRPRLRAELDNLRAAVAWATDAQHSDDAELGLRIVAALAYQAMVYSPAGVGAWAERALARADMSPRRGEVYAAAAWSAWNSAGFAVAKERALTALESGPTPAAATLAFIVVVFGSTIGTDSSEALGFLARAQQLVPGLGGVTVNDVNVHGSLSYFASLSGDRGTAREEAETALRIARQLGNPSAIAVELSVLATAVANEEPDRALHLWEESASLTRAGAADTVFGQTLGLIALSRARTDPIGALETLREAVTYCHHGGLPGEMARTLDRGFRVLTRVGHPEAAAVLVGVLTGPLATPNLIPAYEARDGLAAMDELRARLGPDEYERAVQRGASMSYEEMVGFTLAELDRALAVGARAFPALRALAEVPGNLRAHPASFVGRATERAEVITQVRAHRMVTLTGVGGVGKTRLALEVAADVAARFSGGAWVCELAAAATGDELAHVVAIALGVVQRPQLSMVGSIVDFLRPREVLVVLDNCEHLLDAAAEVAEAALAGAPHVHVLATSREGLGVAGEQVWPLRSLRLATGESGTSEAVELFAARAQAVDPAFTLDEKNLAAVAEVCRRLDGIPLAIELAAARAATMSPAEIAGHLDDRFRLLTGPRRRGVERHQTLRSAIAWSYSLLSATERLVFDRLGVFPSSFDEAAAVAVACGDGVERWDVIDALGTLAAKSMIGVEHTEGSTRYQLLETLRHFAREQLESREEADTGSRRHATHYAGLAEAIGAGLMSPDELQWRPRLVADLDNLRAAVGWAFDMAGVDDVRLGVRIIGSLLMYSAFSTLLGVQAWARAGVPRVDELAVDERAVVLGTAAMDGWYRGDLGAVREFAGRAIDEGRTSTFSAPLAVASTYLGLVIAVTDAPGAMGLLNDARARLAASGLSSDPSGRLIESGLGWLAYNAGDLELARAVAADVCEAAQRSGVPTLIAAALAVLARVLPEDRADEALGAAQESMRLLDGGDSGGPIYAAAAQTAAMLLAFGNKPTAAARALHRAVSYTAERGDQLTSASNIGIAVLVLTAAGDLTAAATLGGLPEGLLAPSHRIVSPEHRQRYDEALGNVARALGPAAFAEAQQGGSAMTYDEVIAFTLARLAVASGSA
jgi:predicted ATPase/DNA-binding SARP family transcriptional activator